MNTSSFEVNDHALIDRIKQGDTRALSYLYKEYYPMVQKLITQNSGNDEAAQDIYQEAIIVLYERIMRGDFDLTSSLKTYLYSVCRNMWMYQLRLKDRALAKFNDFETFINLRAEPLDQEPPEYEKIMHQAIESLGDTCKQLLRYFYFANYSMAEIAEKLGYNNDNTAKSKKNKCMTQAREKAKELLQNYYRAP